MQLSGHHDPKLRLRERVMKRVDPKPGESPRGYIRRVAREFYYGDPKWITTLANLREDDVDRSDCAEQLAYVLRLDAGEWRRIAYKRVGGELSQPKDKSYFAAVQSVPLKLPTSTPGYA